MRESDIRRIAVDLEKKEKYEKPVLVPIELKAEEVLGIGCNKPTMGPAVSDPPGPNCFGASCTAVGTS